MHDGHARRQGALLRRRPLVAFWGLPLDLPTPSRAISSQSAPFRRLPAVMGALRRVAARLRPSQEPARLALVTAQLRRKSSEARVHQVPLHATSSSHQSAQRTRRSPMMPSAPYSCAPWNHDRARITLALAGLVPLPSLRARSVIDASVILALLCTVEPVRIVQDLAPTGAPGAGPRRVTARGLPPLPRDHGRRAQVDQPRNVSSCTLRWPSQLEAVRMPRTSGGLSPDGAAPSWTASSSLSSPSSPTSPRHHATGLLMAPAPVLDLLSRRLLAPHARLRTSRLACGSRPHIPLALELVSWNLDLDTRAGLTLFGCPRGRASGPLGATVFHSLGRGRPRSGLALIMLVTDSQDHCAR